MTRRSPATSRSRRPTTARPCSTRSTHIALPPVIERQSEMQDIVTKALENIADGADAQQTLDGAVDEVNGLLG